MYSQNGCFIFYIMFVSYKSIIIYLNTPYNRYNILMLKINVWAKQIHWNSSLKFSTKNKSSIHMIKDKNSSPIYV